MKKRLSKILAGIIVFGVMAATFTACGSNNTADSSASVVSDSALDSSNAEGSNKLDPVELHFYFPGDPVNEQQAVLNEFYARTKDTLNAKLVFNWIPWGEMKNKIAVKLSAGEEMDSVFDAQWNQLPQMIAKESYIQLDQYFNNDKYPGLKKAFSEEYVNNNKFVDSKGEKHVYGIPFTRDFASLFGYVIRQDLREKYGLPEIKDQAGLEAYFDAVLKNEGGKVIPLGTTLTTGIGNYLQDYTREYNTPWVTAADGLYFRTVFNNDGTVKLVLPGEDDSICLPSTTQRNWYTKGYLEKDVVSQKDSQGLFKVGKFAAIPAEQSTIDNIYREVAKNIPGAKLEYVSINPDVVAKKQHILPTSYQAWNFACIPATSKNAERTMMFFNWMFEDQKNHDLIEYGIEGKHWIAEGTDKFKIPEGTDTTKTYNFPGYVLSWNPKFVRYDADLPQSAVDAKKYAADTNSYILSKLAGFTFNAEPVKNELAKCGPESKKVVTLVDVGVLENSDKALKDLNKKMEKLGLEKIRTEMKKQIEAFLASKK